MNERDSEFRRNERVGRDSFKNSAKDGDGFLRGEVLAARVGVLPYPQPSGVVFWEFTSAEELFSPETLASTNLLPVTIDHPERRLLPDGGVDPRFNGLVDASKAKDLSVGSTGSTNRHDAVNLYIPYCVQQKKAVDDVESGKCEISMGYTYLRIPEVGEYKGQRYTHVKKRIRFNHMAIVDAARVGPMARINLDSLGTPIDEEFLVACDNSTPVNEGGNKENHVKIKVRAVEYEVPAEVAAYVGEIETSIATDSAKAETALGLAVKRAEKAEKDLADEKIAHGVTKTALDAAPASIKKAMAARDALNKKAAKYLDKDEMTSMDASEDVDVMKAAIKKAKPGKAEGLDAKDEKEVRAMFDMLDDPDNEAGANGNDADEEALASQRKTINGGGEDEEKTTGGDRRQEYKPRGREKMRVRNSGIYRETAKA